MRKIIITFTFASAICAALGTTALAAGKCFNWYCVRQKDHVRPTADADMRFVDNYGAYVGKDEKVVYLTFDAGYENGNVARILDTLKAHNAPGAFFVLSNIVKRDTALIKRMADEGHLVCNHTCMHRDMSKFPKAEFTAELEALEKLLHDEAGVECAKFYRPPEGRFSEDNLKWASEIGYKTVLWSFAYADWDNNHQPDPAAAKKLILDNVHNGAILLIHPTSKTNADILGDVLTELEAQGYRFGSLNEIFE